ncbi:MAG: FliA/WhiG family RNA polymerase sigma factor [Chlamydiia bacterium]|nr:FliA/WhiG family RNA polymerase sigma factor [Chlamydiia bacterium]
MGARQDRKELEPVWEEFLKTGAQEAREQLITGYLHLVKYVVGRLVATLPPHVKSEDMFSTGVIGLIKAIEKYDPTKKNKFETYAILLIKGAIIDEMRALDWVPRSVYQKANQIGTAQAKLQQSLGREPTDAEVALELGITVQEYDALLERVRPAVLMPLNAAVDEEGESATLAERIPDDRVKTSFQDADRNEFRQLLEKAVLELPEQERTVLVLYYYENMMLKEIGQVLGVSESRVSQIHTKAVTRLRGRLGNFMQEFANFL